MTTQCATFIAKELVAYIKEDDVPIGIAIIGINPVKPLGELYIAEFLAQLRIHEKTHGFPNGLAVVDVVITVKIQHEGRICENC